jgi:hypothetical protein
MADIDPSLRLWSSTASSNKPTGATPIGTGLDDNLRTIQAVIRQYLASPGTTIASAATVDLSTADGHTIPISGISTVTGLGTEVSGIEYLLTTTGVQVWKNSSALTLPAGTDYTSASGDYLFAESKGSGNWVIPFIGKANGQPIAAYSDILPIVSKSGSASVTLKLSASAMTAARVATMPDRDITFNYLSPMSTSLGADVSLNNTANFFDGPSIAQGTSGTWFASGKVTINDTAGSALFTVKLWDGTTVIDSAQTNTNAASGITTVTLSGYLASPASNIKISVKDVTSASGKILFNSSSSSKDSTITVIRVA